jgi:hypothetical protein
MRRVRFARFHLSQVSSGRADRTLPSRAAIQADKDTHLGSGMPPRSTVLYGTPILREQSSTFIDAYLYRSLFNRDLRYHASTSNSIVSRVSYAVSCDLITRNDSGKSILNRSYLLGVLTSAAVASADRQT